MGQIAIVVIGVSGEGKELPGLRPLYRAGDQHAAIYKGKLWPVSPPGILDCRSSKPLSPDVQRRPASAQETQEFVKASGARSGNVTVKAASPQAADGGRNAVGQDGLKREPAPLSLQAISAALSPVAKSQDVPTEQLVASIPENLQQAIISADATDRILIDAGPGTGKTAVLCERVKHLIDEQGVPASRIWLISFTRTAVQEIRGRVAKLTRRAIANSVNMATLDSLAGQLNRSNGPGQGATTFEDNIRALISNLDESVEVEEQLRDLRHLIVDEAQDIGGVRAELLLKVIGKLPASCGITILSDDAQAIYGFATGDRDNRRGQKTGEPALPERIRAEKLPFKMPGLETIFRTSDQNLTKIFRDVRQHVIGKTGSARERHDRVREEIQKLAHGEAVGDVVQMVQALPEDSFVLYRRRIDAISGSARLLRAAVPHRLRISGLPVTMPAWIAMTLGEFEEPVIGSEAFARQWKRYVEGTAMAVIAVGDAFEMLRRTASDKTGKLIDLRRLRVILATRPPVDFGRPELGERGPIVGTIHACKGREASSVVLFLPSQPQDQESEAGIAEETRVLFVGATRARKNLQTASGGIKYAANTPKGRAYRFRAGKGAPQGAMEVGRLGDLDAAGIAGKSMFTADEIRKNQQAWIRLASARTIIAAYKKKFGDNDYRFCLREEYGGADLGVFTSTVTTELKTVTDEGKRRFKLSSVKHPGMLKNLAVTGLATYVIASDHPAASQLQEPWRATGFVLGPVVYGLSWFTVNK